MEPISQASLHRFRDLVALYLGPAETFYMTEGMATSLAQALLAFAHDIRAVPKFSESKMTTVDLTTN